MKKAVIYVFSGTGNTKRVCRLYQREFTENGIDTTIYDVKSGFYDIPDPNDFDFVGFAYPIHAFNAPKIMLEFCKALPKASHSNNKQGYFILKSSGEPLQINNMSSSKMKTILRRKGFVLNSEYHYVMPYNMIFRHTDEMTVKMLRALEGLVPIEAKEIIDGKEHRLKRVPFAPLLSWIMRIEHPAMQINGRFFKVDDDKCVRCGKCVKNCPVNNISMDENGKFKFAGNCLMCTRCSFNCPTDAFDIALLNKWKVNGAYTYTLPESPEINPHEWYCKKAYRRYFDNADKKISGV